MTERDPLLADGDLHLELRLGASEMPTTAVGERS